MSLLSDEDIFMRLSQHHVNCVRGEGYTWEEVDEYHLDSLEAFSLIRSIEAAILEKLASAELPEPATVTVIKEIPYYTAAQLRQAYAQGAAAQLNSEPVAHLRKNGFRFLGDFEPQDDSELPLYTRKEAK